MVGPSSCILLERCGGALARQLSVEHGDAMRLIWVILRKHKGHGTDFTIISGIGFCRRRWWARAARPLNCHPGCVNERTKSCESPILRIWPWVTSNVRFVSLGLWLVAEQWKWKVIEVDGFKMDLSGPLPNSTWWFLSEMPVLTIYYIVWRYHFKTTREWKWQKIANDGIWALWLYPQELKEQIKH